MRRLPGEARLLLLGVAFDALGTGLILPFLVIYLHEVRHISVAVVGVLAALPAAVALVLLGPLGVLIDRLGPRRVEMGSLATKAVGALVLSHAGSAPVAAVAMLLTGAGQAAFWPASQSLVAAVLPSDVRSRYFGVSFALLNAGIGVGGIIGAIYVSVQRPETFTYVYLGDAASFVVPFVILGVPLRSVGGAAQAVQVDGAERADQMPASYGPVLRDKVFRRLLAVIMLTSFTGYAQIEAGWTAYSRLVGHVSTRVVGLAFVVNTAVIVALQLFVLRQMEGRRRTRVLAALAAVWAVAWAVLGASGRSPGTSVAAVLVITSMGIFAFGETLLSPIGAAITNDIAPEHLRGRYNAAASLAFQLSAIVGPVVAGLLIGRDLGFVYIAVLLVACAVFAALALDLERVLPASANGMAPQQLRPEPEAAPEEGLAGPATARAP